MISMYFICTPLVSRVPLDPLIPRSNGRYPGSTERRNPVVEVALATASKPPHQLGDPGVRTHQLRQTVGMRLNLVIATATLGLTAPLLAACGGGSGSSGSGGYCDELKADKSYFESISGSSSDLSSLDQVFQRMHQLAADAPDSVSADWKTLDGAISTMENALKDAGLKPSDLASLQSGQVPKGVDPSKLAALAPKLQSLSSSDVSKAADNIAADAKKNCSVDLTGN
jgi:hypothetical protein